MTTVPIQPEHDTPARQRTLAQRFDALARQVKLRLAVEGAARSLWVLVAAVIVGALLDHWLEISAWARGLWWLITLTATAYVAYHDLIRPLRLPMGPVDLASALDRCEHAAFGQELAPRVASVFQLQHIENALDQPSPDMIRQAVRRGLDALSDLDLSIHLDQQRFLRHALSLAAAVLLPILIAVMASDMAGVWASRWLAMSDTPWPRGTNLTLVDIEDGRVVVPRGEPFVLKVAVADKPGRAPTQNVTLRVRDENGKKQTIAMTRFGEGDFRHDFGPVMRGMMLSVSARDGKAGPVRITPADRPRITGLEMVTEHPRSPEPTVRDFAPGDGDLTLLPQTAVKLTLSANVPVAEARLNTEADELGELQRISENTFELRWTHTRAVRLSVELVGEQAGLTSHPVPLTIGLRADRAPRVSLRREGVKGRVTPNATIPLTASARDDFALHLLRVEIVRQDPGATAIEVERARVMAEREKAIREAEEAGEAPPVFDEPLPGDDRKPRKPIKPVLLYGPADPANERTAEASHDLELEPHELAIGELVRITAVALDDRHDGRQTGRSRVLTFRITPPDELFREILLRQQALRSRFRKSRTAAEELKDAMAVYTGEPEQAKALLSKHRLAQRSVWQVNRSLGESATEMRLNKLGGEESYELLRRYVLEPMTKLHDQTMTRQRQDLERLSQADAAHGDLIEAVVKRQQQTMDDMDAILKAMNQWDSFIDVVNQLNEIIKIQEQVDQFVEKLKEDEDEGLFED